MLQSPEEIRAYYKPDKVGILFIGEAPPSHGKFFYLANSNLYRCIQGAFSKIYGNKCGEGEAFLAFFKKQGCYLDDLCLVSINDKVGNERQKCRCEGIEPLAKRIKEMQPRSIVVLMKGIKREVRSAMQQSGLSPAQFYVTPFPAHSKKNKQSCVDENEQVLRALIAENVLWAL